MQHPLLLLSFSLFFLFLVPWQSQGQGLPDDLPKQNKYRRGQEFQFLDTDFDAGFAPARMMSASLLHPKTRHLCITGGVSHYNTILPFTQIWCMRGPNITSPRFSWTRSQSTGTVPSKRAGFVSASTSSGLLFVVGGSSEPFRYHVQNDFPATSLLQDGLFIFNVSSQLWSHRSIITTPLNQQFNLDPSYGVVNASAVLMHGDTKLYLVGGWVATAGHEPTTPNGRGLALSNGVFMLDLTAAQLSWSVVVPPHTVQNAMRARSLANVVKHPVREQLLIHGGEEQVAPAPPFNDIWTVLPNGTLQLVALTVRPDPNIGSTSSVDGLSGSITFSHGDSWVIIGGRMQASLSQLSLTVNLTHCLQFDQPQPHCTADTRVGVYIKSGVVDAYVDVVTDVVEQIYSRTLANFAFDPISKRCLIFSGLSDTLIYHPHPVADGYIWDMGQSRFTDISVRSWPIARRNFATCLYDNHTIAMFGGKAYNGFGANDLWLFDLDSRLWTLLSPRTTGSGFPAHRDESCILRGPYSDLIYLFAGDYVAFNPTNFVWSFNVSSRLWSKILKNPAAKSQFQPAFRMGLFCTHRVSNPADTSFLRNGPPPLGTVIPSGLLYGGNADALVHEYHFSNDTWGAPLVPAANNQLQPRAQRNVFGVLVDDVLYLVGGRHSPNDLSKRLMVWSFSLHDRTWLYTYPESLQTVQLDTALIDYAYMYLPNQRLFVTEKNGFLLAWKLARNASSLSLIQSTQGSPEAFDVVADMDMGYYAMGARDRHVATYVPSIDKAVMLFGYTDRIYYSSIIAVAVPSYCGGVENITVFNDTESVVVIDDGSFANPVIGPATCVWNVDIAAAASMVLMSDIHDSDTLLVTHNGAALDVTKKHTLHLGDKLQFVLVLSADNAISRQGFTATLSVAHCGLSGTYASIREEQCYLCSLGTYSNTSGGTTCAACSESSFASTRGMSQCVPCPEGTVGNHVTQQCIPCSPGQFLDSVSLSCTPCPQHTYQDMPRQTVCKRCPKNTRFNLVGAESARKCVCDFGTWFDISMNSSYGENGCRPCPHGGHCIGRMFLPAPAQGWYHDNSLADGAFLECLPIAACPLVTPTQDVSWASSQCADGYTGIRCSQCAPSHVRYRKECHACPSFTVTTVLLVSGILVAISFLYGVIHFFTGSATALLYDRSRMRKSRGSLTIIIDFFQVIYLFSLMDIRWPSSVGGLALGGSMLTFSLDELFYIKCAVPYDFYQSFRWRLFSPLLIIFVVLSSEAMMWLFARFWRNVLGMRRYPHIFFLAESDRDRVEEEDAEWRCVHWLKRIRIVLKESDEVISWQIFKRIHERRWDLYVAASVYLMNLAYTQLVTSVFAFFSCMPIADGNWVLIAEPHFRCFDTQWNNNLVFAIIAVLLYPLGIPAFFLYNYVNYSRAISSASSAQIEQYEKRFGHLVGVFKTRLRFWFLVPFARKLLVISIISFAARDILKSTTILLPALASMTLLEVTMKPFRAHYNNVMNTMSMLSLFLILLFGSVSYSDLTADPGSNQHLFWLFVILFMLFFGTAAYALFAEMILPLFWPSYAAKLRQPKLKICPECGSTVLHADHSEDDDDETSRGRRMSEPMAIPLEALSRLRTERQNVLDLQQHHHHHHQQQQQQQQQQPHHHQHQHGPLTRRSSMGSLGSSQPRALLDHKK